MNYFTKLAVLPLSVGLALIGCSQADEAVEEATPVVAALAASTPAAVKPIQQSADSPDVADSQKAKTVAVEFTPPFPQRLELFQPPQRALSAARRDGDDGETVELKGFIYVDEPRVVLSIDGVVSSVPKGGEKYGVQVISIDPPTAVLRRGGRSWPATLE